MSDYVTVIFSRDEAIDFCKEVEALKLEQLPELLDRTYQRLMHDLARMDGKKEEVENVR